MTKKLISSDELSIEAYRSLQNENSWEARDTMTLDVIFIASIATWSFKSGNLLSVLPSCLLAIVCLTITVLWWLLSWRTHCRKDERIKLMTSIERHLDFCAYRAMETYVKQARWKLVQYPVYRGVVAAAVGSAIILDLYSKHVQ